MNLQQLPDYPMVWKNQEPMDDHYPQIVILGKR